MMGVKAALQGVKQGLLRLQAVAALALPAVLADARLRGVLGAALSGALAIVGLHVSGDTLLAVVALGTTLAATGPHQAVTNG